MEEFFTRVRQFVVSSWQNLTPAQRFWSIGASAGAFLALIAIVFMVQRTHWVELGSFRDAQVAAQIKAELEKRGYILGQDFKLSDDARTIHVDATKRNVMYLALAEQGLVGHQERGFKVFEDFDITTTDYEQRLKTLEALKSEMRRMLRSYDQVEDVDISVPYIEKESIFIDEKEEQTASAVITLKPGTKLNDGQIRAIRRLISGGFAGLAEENITLTNQFMELLMPEGDDKALSTKQMQVEDETERSLERKIRTVLGRVLGADHFAVSVDVEFDWDNIKVNQTIYEAPGFEQLEKSHQKEQERLVGEGLRPGGEPGVSSNSPPVYNAIGTTGPVDYTRTEEIVNFLANQTVTDRIRAPYVKKLSAAVAVDGFWKDGRDTEGEVKHEYTARTDKEMEDIRGLVVAAIGTDAVRNDLVEVRNIKWNRDAEWERKEKEIKEKDFRLKAYIAGAAAILLLLAGFVAYNAWRRHERLREEELARQRELERQRALAAAEAGLAGEISLEEQERQEIQRRAASLARAKPQVVAELLRTWMSEESKAA